MRLLVTAGLLKYKAFDVPVFLVHFQTVLSKDHKYAKNAGGTVSEITLRSLKRTVFKDDERARDF